LPYIFLQIVLMITHAAVCVEAVLCGYPGGPSAHFVIDEVYLDEGLNNIEELEVLEVIIRGYVQLLEEIVLLVELAPEIFTPTQRPSQFEHKISEIAYLNEASALYQKQKRFK
jgi:hypothetical protein